MLRWDLCDYSDAYILVKGMITLANPDNDEFDKELTLKNNAPFASFILKINNTLIDNAEALDIVMPMYNLLEYSKNNKKQQEVYLNGLYLKTFISQHQSTIMDIILWDFFILYQILFSPQVKWSVIISNKHG